MLRRVAEKRELTNKYRALKQRLDRLEGTPDLIGQSQRMEYVRRLIAKVAPTESTVLILGETGTGKELVARAVHEQSRRAEMPLVPVNCGALPETLIESELFGHRKGAFTGAEEHRTGLLQVANGGTLFLDEIGELPKLMQSKLLRFLESGEVRRVGDNESFTCDVRVICATNRDLAAMVEAGEFREDLWFRINTFEIPLPSLRERVEDIPPLARHLAGRFRRGDGRRRFDFLAGGAGGVDGAQLARQRPRIGQCDRARHDTLRPPADLSGTFATAILCTAGRVGAERGGWHTESARARNASDSRGAEPTQREQAKGRRGVGR